MPALPFPVRLGTRPLVALTCSVCHRLRSGTDYERTTRGVGAVPYVDRRCRRCRWARLESSPGR